jgi:putative redox protein
VTITVTRNRTGKNDACGASARQRTELLNVAGKCPVHRMMTQVTTEIATELAEA